jgi:hypothetical protein
VHRSLDPGRWPHRRWRRRHQPGPGRRAGGGATVYLGVGRGGREWLGAVFCALALPAAGGHAYPQGEGAVGSAPSLLGDAVDHPLARTPRTPSGSGAAGNRGRCASRGCRAITPPARPRRTARRARGCACATDRGRQSATVLAPWQCGSAGLSLHLHDLITIRARPLSSH